ncbi:hypothetical protein BDV39DRAFT_47710 [Aspergillus sergii]|uniref:Uncharacterized protein n=1 Tax=Aspergillus sergii TaxID=1034303 RepID=A0A5N6X856_9EURO|nr:hypothetical protein BDV39DRAFT_47710 [Aspergillus sergii]
MILPRGRNKARQLACFLAFTPSSRGTVTTGKEILRPGEPSLSPHKIKLTTHIFLHIQGGYSVSRRIWRNQEWRQCPLDSNPVAAWLARSMDVYRAVEEVDQA